VIDAAFFRGVNRFCKEHPALAGALHYHDWLVYELVRLSGHSWTFDSESRIRYRQHASNEIGARGGAGAIRSRLAKINDGWFRAQIVAALRIYAVSPAQIEAADRFREYFASNAKPSRTDRLVLAALLARHSRRRISDRLVLVAAALLGWLDPI
jgi:rhamnosyltransferase